MYTLTAEEIIDLLVFVQGIVFGLVLLFKAEGGIAKRILGCFLLSYSVEITDLILEKGNYYEVYPSLYFLPIYFIGLTFPLLFLYAKSVTANLRWSKDWIHLIPGSLEFIIGMVLFTIASLGMIKHDGWEIISMFYYLGGFLFMLFYSIKLFVYINRYMRKANDYYSNMQGKNIRWVYRVALLNLSIGVAFIVLMFFPEENNYISIDLMLSVFNAVFVFWISIGGLMQLTIKEAPEMEEVAVVTEEYTNEEKDESVAEKPLDYQEEYKSIVQVLESDKLYANPELTLGKLAKDAGINQRVVSKAINQNANQNFNLFINTYRVEEAKRLLKNGEYEALCIEAIGEMAGFNSKATFYATFKKICGISPSVFRES
ncbi:AraC family transcriptional regulator [Puteibacter caeruleilacunae]|nr:AraC family transcriptional regulator [Puteibacter caeruleilacunae]